MQAIDEELMRRIRNDLIDSYDEALEMELEDRTVAELTGTELPERVPHEDYVRHAVPQEIFMPEIY